ncbi:hypothetical protein ACFE04_029279 [Oxalis oulophora]
MKATYFFCFVLFLTLIPNKSFSEDSSDLIYKTCIRTTFDDFCESELRQNGGNDTTDLNSLAAVSLKVAKSQVLTIQKYLIDYIGASPPDEYAAVACLKIFNVTISRVKKSITALGHKRYDRVTSWMYSSITDTTKCEVASQEFGSVVHDKSEVFKKTCYIELSTLFLIKYGDKA